MMFGADLELRHMSISELTPMPERARRIEVFTGAGRRRNWPADEKAAIVAESYAPGRTVCGVARRHGLPPAQLFTWRRLARRSRSRVPVQKPPALFVPAVVEPSPGLPLHPALQPQSRTHNSRHARERHGEAGAGHRGLPARAAGEHP